MKKARKDWQVQTGDFLVGEPGRTEQTNALSWRQGPDLRTSDALGKQTPRNCLHQKDSS
jgi:hypothetical protein